MRKYIIVFLLMSLYVFSYDIEEKNSLILNTDGKYYIRDAEKPYTGFGIFDNEISYYYGFFKDGVKNGYGQNICLGEVYVGEFKDGLFDGKGVLKEQNGKISEGIWKRSVLKKTIKTGYRNEYINRRINEITSFNSIFNIGN